jgi:hypothetical protein
MSEQVGLKLALQSSATTFARQTVFTDFIFREICNSEPLYRRQHIKIPLMERMNPWICYFIPCPSLAMLFSPRRASAYDAHSTYDFPP